MNERDTEVLAENFELRTGVDLRTYRRPEIAELVADLLRFPFYAAKAIFWPLVAFLVPTVLVAFAVTGVWMTLLASIAAASLSLLNALTTAAVVMIVKLSDDIVGVINVGVLLAGEVTQDVRNVQLKQTNKTFEVPSFVETLNGVMHVVIVPIVAATLRRKIPLIGRVFGIMIRWLAGLTTRRTVKKLVKAHPEVLDTIPPESVKESVLVERLEYATAMAKETSEYATGAVVWARWVLIVPAVFFLVASLTLTILVYRLIL